MQLRRTLLAVLAAALLPLGAAAAQDAAADSMVLRPGDVIRLVVWRQPDFSGEFPVSPEGTVQHPLLSDVRVVDVPRAVVRDRLRQALQRYEREPNFVFDYMYRVGVGGEVRLPNLYTVPPETTLGQAIATAGGTNEFGRLDRVHLIRGAHDVVVNLLDPQSGALDMKVHSGDQLRVSRRGNLMRDFIVPAATIISAAAALTALVTR